MVKVEASRRQLQADLKEENKLQAELVRKVQLSRLKDNLISQKSVSTVDTSVQANYLAVAPGQPKLTDADIALIFSSPLLLSFLLFLSCRFSAWG